MTGRCRLTEAFIVWYATYAESGGAGARDRDRGDVAGWVLVTLMTAGLVLTLWAVAGPRFEEVFNDAKDRVVGGP